MLKGYNINKQNASRIESESEVKAYIQNIKYALDHGAKIQFQRERFVDRKRNPRYTNAYTVAALFPNEIPEKALARELRTLTVENYVQTLKDLRFPNNSEMRQFGKVYDGMHDVYVKVRIELIGENGMSTTYVMSFHFAERPFSADMFPYARKD